ncbi:hypothetical protein [Martelella endophytica]|uniref:hypothetical protein n=1 Tax=Martelella endophytica TaxID=1486262 RepID=UPI00130DFE07|nr:hypothetical protein [Martelella endophytica]
MAEYILEKVARNATVKNTRSDQTRSPAKKLGRRWFGPDRGSAFTGSLRAVQPFGLPRATLLFPAFLTSEPSGGASTDVVLFSFLGFLISRLLRF